MSGSRASFLHRLKSMLGRPGPEPTLRESIAELMQEAADDARSTGGAVGTGPA